MMKTRRMIGRILTGLLTGITVFLVVVVLGLAVAQRRAPDGVPRFDGQAVLSVLSGSMTPVFRTGDGILDRTVNLKQAENLKVGQIITFKTGRIYQGKPMMITHRIVGIATITAQATGRKQRLYVTKGDANNSIDSGMVAPANVVGVFEGRIPYLGYVSGFVHQPLGFILLLVVPLLYLVGGIFMQLWRQIDEQERKVRAQTAATQGGDGSH